MTLLVSCVCPEELQMVILRLKNPVTKTIGKFRYCPVCGKYNYYFLTPSMGSHMFSMPYDNWYAYLSRDLCPYFKDGTLELW